MRNPTSTASPARTISRRERNRQLMSTVVGLVRRVHRDEALAERLGRRRRELEHPLVRKAPEPGRETGVALGQSPVGRRPGSGLEPRRDRHEPDTVVEGLIVCAVCLHEYPAKRPEIARFRRPRRVPRVRRARKSQRAQHLELRWIAVFKSFRPWVEPRDPVWQVSKLVDGDRRPSHGARSEKACGHDRPGG